ncbi:MAG: phospholipase D-like domain-containing protein [Caldimonas sp.]
MLIDLLLRNWLTLHGLIVLFGLGIYVMASRALYQRRHPSAAIAWVVMLTLLPYVALPLYFMFGSRKVRSGPRLSFPEATIVRSNGADDLAAWSRRLGGAMGLPNASGYAGLRIHADGSEALAALRELILGARSHIDLCTFLLARDALGREIGELLMQRARDGVRVRVLLDGFGVWLGGHFDLGSLRAAGIEVVKFVPALKSAVRGLNLRNHRKMLLADGERFWAGGRNIASEYFEGDAARGLAPWHDLSYDVGGPLAQRAQQRFDLDWNYAAHLPSPAPARDDGDGDNGRDDGALAQLIPSGPDQIDDTVQALLVSGAFMARERILAVTPYFVPDATLLMALSLAARRGIAVDLVLPARSNHRLADVARNRPLRDLERAGARVWFTAHMVHAKAVVIDDGFALAGSANLDARSLFLNYELMVAFYRPDDVARFAAWIDGERRLAAAYRAKPPGFVRDLAEGLVLWLAFQL